MNVELKDVVGRDFDNEVVALDGIEFVDCTFSGCSLTYSGGPPFVFTRCSFDENTTLEPKGCALNTINALWTAQHYGFAQWPEKVIANILRPNVSH